MMTLDYDYGTHMTPASKTSTNFHIQSSPWLTQAQKKAGKSRFPGFVDGDSLSVKEKMVKKHCLTEELTCSVDGASYADEHLSDDSSQTKCPSTTRLGYALATTPSYNFVTVH